MKRDTATSTPTSISTITRVLTAMPTSISTHLSSEGDLIGRSDRGGKSSKAKVGTTSNGAL